MKRNLSNIAMAIVILMIIGTSVTFWNYDNSVQLIGLSNQSNRQMMGYIMKTKDHLIAIDGGTREDAQNFLEYVEKNGGKIHYWFITHLHDDHIGTFLEVMRENKITVEHIIFSINQLEWYQENDSSRFDEVKEFFDIIQREEIKPKTHEVYLGETIKIDNVNCKVLATKNPEIIENAGNNQSMVLKFQVNDKSILFLGDAGLQEGEKLLNMFKNELKSDFVQMAHHGQAGVGREVYEVVSPTACLWPTPEWLWNNDNGGGEDSGEWKTKETRQWMEEMGVLEHYIEKDGVFELKIY